MKTPPSAAQWRDSPRGTQILCQEKHHLEQALPRLFGRTLLQVGCWGGALLDSASHWRTGVLGPDADAQVVCDLAALPLAPSSVDAMLLAHSLEAAVSPHRLLREVDQALTSRGQLLILGFNPHSVWGLAQRFLPRYTPLPAHRQLLSTGRITDWLRLLDYEVQACDRYGPGAALTGRLAWLQGLLNGFEPGYLIRARKRHLPVNPVRRPAWRRAPVDLGTVRIGTLRSAA